MQFRLSNPGQSLSSEPEYQSTKIQEVLRQLSAVQFGALQSITVQHYNKLYIWFSSVGCYTLFYFFHYHFLCCGRVPWFCCCTVPFLCCFIVPCLYGDTIPCFCCFTVPCVCCATVPFLCYGTLPYLCCSTVHCLFCGIKPYLGYCIVLSICCCIVT